MQVNIVGRHMTLTPAIEEYIHRKMEKLPRHFDRVQQIEVIVQKETNEYHVEIVTDVEHHRDFIANGRHEDLYACVDITTDRAVRQLSDWKDRLRQHKQH
jgi:putative sigma-54 modulation protein